MVKHITKKVLVGLMLFSTISSYAHDSNDSYSQRMWSYYENLRDWRFIPHVGVALGASALTAVVLEVGHWIKRRRESEYEICIRAEQLLQQVNELDKELSKLRNILTKNDITVEEQLERIFTSCDVNALSATIPTYLEQLGELYLKLGSNSQKQNKEEIEKIQNVMQKMQQEIQQLAHNGEFLLHNQAYFIAKNELIVCDKLLTSNTVESDQITLSLKKLTEVSNYLSPYPILENQVKNVNAKLTQFHRAVQQREREEKVKGLSQKIDRKFDSFGRELSTTIAPENIENWVAAAQVKTQNKYRYINYAQLLQNTIQEGDSIINELQQIGLPFDQSIIQRLNKLKSVEQFIHQDAYFMRSYNEDLEKKRRDNLEEERLKADQERAEAERRKAKAIEEQNSIEQAKLNAQLYSPPGMPLLPSLPSLGFPSVASSNLNSYSSSEQEYSPVIDSPTSAWNQSSHFPSETQSGTQMDQELNTNFNPPISPEYDASYRPSVMNQQYDPVLDPPTSVWNEDPYANASAPPMDDEDPYANASAPPMD